MIDGIYTAYLSGQAGQGLAMFVFVDGTIAGADLTGITFSGKYVIEGDRMKGSINYEMPAGTTSITGASFDSTSGNIAVPIDLPVNLDPNETYRIVTPIGPVNAIFVKNIKLERHNGSQ